MLVGINPEKFPTTAEQSPHKLMVEMYGEADYKKFQLESNFGFWDRIFGNIYFWLFFIGSVFVVLGRFWEVFEIGNGIKARRRNL